LPGLSDVKQFFQHIAWFLGIGSPPDFDRWGYWEKFDYWAVFWGMSIIGLTGLLLIYPLSTTKIIPGWGLNVAFWVHRIEALLAMGHIFIIHFFIGHLRRHSFPMDRSMFEGSASLKALEEEKPAWIQRLKENGAFDQALVANTSGGMHIVYYVFGYAAIFFGLFLLIGALANLTGVSWY
jgi:cytochrome b subunit of formate dehydrogenase